MTRVRLVSSISGMRDGEAWPPAGSVVDLPDVEAAELVSAGIAAPVESREEAAVPSDEGVETATRPRKGGHA